MNLPAFVPTPEEGFQKLSHLIEHLQPAFEDAVFQAKNYMETKQLKYDVNSLYMMIRLHVKNYLTKLGIPETEFKFDDLSLEGISFRNVIEDARFRIWKAEDHELPPPGDSKTREAYYNQQYILNLDGDSKREKLNRFAVLWNLGPQNKLTLWLVCPKVWDDETKKADSWWSKQIPEPTLGIEVKTDIGTPSGDLPMESAANQKKDTKPN